MSDYFHVRVRRHGTIYNSHLIHVFKTLSAEDNLTGGGGGEGGGFGRVTSSRDAQLDR